MRHTCDTVRSGSERSENTCAACHDEVKRSRFYRPIDWTAEWERQTAGVGRKDVKTGGAVVSPGVERTAAWMVWADARATGNIVVPWGFLPEDIKNCWRHVAREMLAGAVASRIWGREQ